MMCYLFSSWFVLCCCNNITKKRRMLPHRFVTTWSSVTTTRLAIASRINGDASEHVVAGLTRRSFAAKRVNPGDKQKQAYRKPNSIELEQKLSHVENRLQQIELDTKYGKNRGIKQLQKILKDDTGASTKKRRNNRRVLDAELKSLLYSRHALQHGVLRLKDLTKKNAITKSFLGDDTKQNISIEHAKTILLQEFRYGESSLLESFHVKHNKQQEQMQKKAAAARRRAAAAAAEAEKQQTNEGQPQQELDDEKTQEDDCETANNGGEK